MKTKITLLSLFFCSTVFSQVNTNLVLDLDFENGINDSSSQNQMTAINSTVGYGNDRWSNANAAVQFSGNSNPGSVVLTNYTGTYKVSYPATISAWVKLNSFGSPSSPIVTTEDHSTSYSGLWVEVLPTGAIMASFGNGGAAGSTSRKSAITDTGVVALNNWYHIAAVYRSSSVIDIYVNGFKVSSTMSGSALSCYYYMGAGLGLGGAVGGFYKGSTLKTLDGSIDKVKIFGGALNRDEIWALYFNTHSNSSTLLFNYHMSSDHSDSSIYHQASSQIGTCNYATDRFGTTVSALDAAANSAIQLDNPLGNYKTQLPATFSAWIKIDSLNATNSIFTNEDNSTDYSGIWIHLTSLGQIAVNIGDGSGSGSTGRKSYITVNSIPVDTQWKHLVVVMHALPSNPYFTTEIYVNGVLYSVGAASGTGSGLLYFNNVSNNGKIGSYIKGGTSPGYFNGQIDDAMFWNIDLTGTEVLGLYSTQVTNGVTSVGVKDQMNVENGVSVYPNPATDKLNVVLKNSLIIQSYSVFDITGKKVMSETINADNLNVDLRGFERGLYIIRLITDIGIISKKFVKE